MRLLMLPVELPLRVAGHAARLGLKGVEAVVERVVGQDSSSPAPSPPPTRTPTPASARATGGANGSTDRGGAAAASGRPGATRRPAGSGGGATTRRRPPHETADKPRRGAAAPKRTAPAPPEQAAPQDVPRETPDGTRVDRVPTGATPASPTAPASEADLVGSFGPERDAGAQIHVTAPFENYDKLSAPDLVDRLRGADAATRAAVALYEGQNRKRKSVLAAAQRSS